jgi:hypothetical protein
MPSITGAHIVNPHTVVLQDNKLAFATADRWQLESSAPG